jgi:hypothetical protein
MSLKQVHSRLYGEGTPAAGIQYLMASSILKQATADDDKFYSTFPPLSKLTSIQEQIFRQLLFHCGLAMY